MQRVTAQAVGAHLSGIVQGEIRRYELPQLCALQFVCSHALHGERPRQQPQRRDQGEPTVGPHRPPASGTTSGSRSSAGSVSGPSPVSVSSTPAGSTVVEIQLGSQAAPESRLDR